MRLDARQRNTRGDRDQEFCFSQFTGDFFSHRVDDLRLDCQDDNVGVITKRAVVRRNVDIELSGYRFPQGVAHIARHDMALRR